MLKKLKSEGRETPIAGMEAVQTVAALKALIPAYGADATTKEEVKQCKKEFALQPEPCQEMSTALSNLVGQIVSRKKAQVRKHVGLLAWRLHSLRRRAAWGFGL